MILKKTVGRMMKSCHLPKCPKSLMIWSFSSSSCLPDFPISFFLKQNEKNFQIFFQFDYVQSKLWFLENEPVFSSQNTSVIDQFYCFYFLLKNV